MCPTARVVLLDPLVPKLVSLACAYVVLIVCVAAILLPLGRTGQEQKFKVPRPTAANQHDTNNDGRTNLVAICFVSLCCVLCCFVLFRFSEDQDPSPLCT